MHPTLATTMLSRYSRKSLRRIITPETFQHGGSRCCERLFSAKGDGKSGSVGDYFTALRWKAANALTSNLPDEERNLLLDKLSGKDTTGKDGDAVVPKATTGGDEDDDDGHAATSYEPSIDEAIAAAKLQEAERYEKKWEHDKEALLAEAEKAARSRIESDIEIQKRQVAFEAWKSGLEREKKQDDDDNSANKVKMDSAAAAAASDAGIQDEMPSKEGIGEHPVLGQMIADLGFKRIHLASQKNLATIPIWKKQRIYRHGRSKNMATEKKKTIHLGLPGVIGIFEKTDGSLSIIDGQHRIGMLTMLKEKVASNDFDFDNVLVEVYPAQKDQNEDLQAKEIFLEVNKAEPVKLVDLPGVAKAKDRKIINEVAERLRDTYPDMFSESQRCRSPHLNIDNLRDALFASKIIEKHSMKTSKALEEWILERNASLEIEFQDEENTNLVSAKALKKANRLGFYLGLDSGWLYK